MRMEGYTSGATCVLECPPHLMGNLLSKTPVHTLDALWLSLPSLPPSLRLALCWTLDSAPGRTSPCYRKGLALGTRTYAEQKKEHAHLAPFVSVCSTRSQKEKQRLEEDAWVVWSIICFLELLCVQQATCPPVMDIHHLQVPPATLEKMILASIA